jgi:hypothetical protein
MGRDRRNEVNVRAPRVLLAATAAICGRCGGATRVFALVVPPGHLVLEPDDGCAQDAAAPAEWCVAPHGAFLFHVGFVNDAAARRLRRLTRGFRAVRTDCADCWANHCECCGSMLEDQDLFCEPGGAFLPESPELARRIHLVAIDEPFEACAAGFDHDPPFFDAMS